MEAKVRTLIAQIIALSMILLGSATLAAGQTSGRQATDSSLARLQEEIARLTRDSGGIVGVAAIHLETGRRVSLNGSERFPMASTFKVPVAVQLLSRVDAGEIKLDQMIELKTSDLHPGSGTLADLFNKPGVALSLRNLIELMLLISDNSAADICLKLAGGPEAVTAKLRSLGIDGISVNRSTARLIADWVGVESLPPENTWTPALFGTLLSSVKPEEHQAAARRFDADPRDTSTPDGMAMLLQLIYQKSALKPESADLLLDIMRRCRTGDARLKGLLPAGTVVAHKTGTIGGSANDVGIITLPGDAGHVIVAAFVKSSSKEEAARERLIAEAARTIHDFFLFEQH